MELLVGTWNNNRSFSLYVMVTVTGDIAAVSILSVIRNK
jgi:hypothetical protein